MDKLNNLDFSLKRDYLKVTEDDVVIIDACRTPLTKANKGLLKDTAPEIMVQHVLEAIVARTGIKKDLVDDIIFGNVLQTGAGFFTDRMAQFLAGFPHTTSIASLNRLCSSGLEACAVVAGKI